MKYLVFLLLFVSSSFAHAGSTGYLIRMFTGTENCTGPNGNHQYFPDPGSACAALTSGLQSSGSRCSTPSGSYILESTDNMRCVWRCINVNGMDCSYAEPMRVGCADGSDPQDGQCPTNKQCPMYGTAEGDAAAGSQPAGCECPSGTKWSGAGCRKTCNSSRAGEDANAGFDLFIPDGQSEGCFGGCGVQHKSGGYEQGKGGKFAPATYTGWACSGNGDGTKATPDGKPEPDSPKLDDSKKHPPKCGADEGVLTSSSGSVNCVPSGTPNSSTPKVENKKNTETFPDGSTKTTETTTTADPNTNASSTTTTTTSSGGMAGPAGVSSSSSSRSSGPTGTGSGGNGDSDDGEFCQKNPTMSVCLHGKAKDKGKFDSQESALNDAKTAFSDYFNTVKGEATSVIGGFNVAGAGTMPCRAPISVLGRQFSLCFSKYDTELSVVGLVVMFVAAVASAYIVFGGKS